MAKKTIIVCDFCDEEIKGDVYEIRVTRKLKGSDKRAELVSRQDACQECAETPIVPVMPAESAKPEE